MRTSGWAGWMTVWVLAATLVGRAAEGTKPDQDVREAIELFRKTDPKIEKLLESSAGDAVFPSVAQGAVGIGAAEGCGAVFAKGKLIGTVKLTQVTAGAQLGGQTYAEVIFFELIAGDVFDKSEVNACRRFAELARPECPAEDLKKRALEIAAVFDPFLCAMEKRLMKPDRRS